jgi:hypothetical protein|tara:strand:- start:4410 stop:6527 length:2118 start_codon:yes stop_codon:yes gene_type:complete
MARASKPLTPMSDSQLLTIAESYVSDGLDFQQSKLSSQMADSLRYYYGDKLGNEVKGRSQVVSKDVADAVDWIMPSLMRIFGDTEKVVEFCPRNEEDKKIAKQAQEYVNYLYTQRNNGFMNTYSVIQDALLAKNGIMKHYYKEIKEPEFTSYEGVNREQLEILLLEEGTELMAMTELPDQEFFDVEISKMTVTKKLCIEAIPPEEFVIDTWSDTIEEASFVGHRRMVTRSELVASGFDQEIIYGLQETGNSALRGGNSSAVVRARNSYDQAQNTGTSTTKEISQEQVIVTEGIIRADYDGDGIAEKRRVVFAQNTLLVNERFDEPLFTDFRVHVMAHKFYGLSMYDQLRDVQRIKTTLQRNILDNMYTLNNGRYEVVDGQVNMDDLLNNRLGGVVRTKMAGAIRQLDTPALPVQNFTMLDYLDRLKDSRTGVSNTTRGMNDSVLHSNQAASAVADVMSAAEQKQELIARVLANSFTKLFKNIYKLTMIHQDQEEIFMVRGEYVTVNPSHWRKDYDVLVKAGIGDGKTAEKIMNAQMMTNLMSQLKGQGLEDIIFNEESVYNLLTEITKNAGYEDPHKYWLDPTTPERKELKAQKAQAAQQPSVADQLTLAEAADIPAKRQQEAQSMQMEMEAKLRELEVRDREASVKERELDLKQQEIDIKDYEAKLKHGATAAEIQLEMEQGRGVKIGDRKAPNVTDGNITPKV